MTFAKRFAAGVAFTGALLALVPRGADGIISGATMLSCFAAAWRLSCINPWVVTNADDAIACFI